MDMSWVELEKHPMLIWDPPHMSPQAKSAKSANWDNSEQLRQKSDPMDVGEITWSNRHKEESDCEDAHASGCVQGKRKGTGTDKEDPRDDSRAPEKDEEDRMEPSWLCETHARQRNECT